jgi:PKD repeat protein
LANLNIGNNTIEVWTAFNGDGITQNDTIVEDVSVFFSTNTGPNFTQNFDNFSNCSTAWDCELVTCSLQNGWVNIPNGSGDDIDWRTHSGSTGSAGTGPSSDHTSGAGKYVYLEGSGPCNNSTAKMYSPCFNLNGISTAQLTFWYHAFGSSIGELHVDVLADGELIEDVMTPIIGDQGDQWIEQTIDLSQFSNQQIVLIFRGSNGSSGWLSDLALDDIQLQTSPIAQYAVSQDELCLNQTTTLSNSSSFGTSYSWSFQPNNVNYEAGTNNNSSNPQVSFSAPGWYTVELIATNSIGNDTLTNIDYIYVWGEQNPMTVSALCSGDSIIAQTNNNGRPTSFYLNGMLESSGIQASHYYPSATEGDTLYAAFDVNSTCTLYTDTVIIDLQEVETGINQTGSQLNAVATGAQYQWLDCLDNFSPINGETGSSFAPSSDGEYAVEVTENGCVDTSDCLVFSTVSMSSVALQDMMCYPNPTTGEITIQFGTYQSAARIEVLSILGERIAEYNVTDTDQFMLSIPGEPAVYMLRVTINQEEKLFRVIKQ